MNRRGKATALSTAAAATLVLVGTGITATDWIREEWYLRKLKGGDEEVAVAIERLGVIGSERSLVALTRKTVELLPEIIRSLDSPFASRDGQLEPPRLELKKTQEWHNRFAAIGLSIGKVRDRIGLERAQAAVLEVLRIHTEELRVRLWLAQCLAFGEASNPDFEVIASDRMKSEGKHAATEVMIEALCSPDELCRAGASYTLTFCGLEAAQSIPFLEVATQDSSSRVRQAAAEALKKIQGKQDEAQR